MKSRQVPKRVASRHIRPLSSALIFLMLLNLLLTGCLDVQVPSDLQIKLMLENQTLNELDKLITTWQPANWQKALSDTADKIKANADQLVSTVNTSYKDDVRYTADVAAEQLKAINNDAQNFLNRVQTVVQEGIADAGITARCTTQFFTQSVNGALIQDVIYLKSALGLGKGEQLKPPEPWVCQFLPKGQVVIAQNGQWRIVEPPDGVIRAIGYNFSYHGRPTVRVYNRDGQPIGNFAFQAEFQTPYEVDLDFNGLNLPDQIPAGSVFQLDWPAFTSAQPNQIRALIATPTPALPPSPPVEVRADPTGQNSIHVSWKHDPQNVTSFEISPGDQPDVVMATVPANGQSVYAWDVGGLNCAQEYVYLIRATNDVGKSAQVPARALTGECPTPIPPVPATLVRAQITNIHTFNQNKDRDTDFEVWIDKPGGGRCASARFSTGMFGENTDHGPYPLDVNTGCGPNDIQNGAVHLCIYPNGNDRWNFQFQIEVWFLDGSHLGANSAYQNVCKGCPSWGTCWLSNLTWSP